MSYLPNIKEGIKHLDGRFKEGEDLKSIERYKQFIHEKPQLAARNLAMLSQNYRAQCLLTFFRDVNVDKAKLYAFQATLVNIRLYQLRPTSAPSGYFDTLIYPLVTFDHKLTLWYAQFLLPLLNTRYDNPNMYEYYSLLAKLALNKDYETLSQYLDIAEHKPPKKMRSYKPDLIFYRGLIEGNISKMMEGISELLKPKTLKVRNTENPYGFEENLFSVPLFILERIAAFNGYVLPIESDWLPRFGDGFDETRIDNDFVKEIDINADFIDIIDDKRSWCLNVNDFRPKPDGSLSFNEHIENIKRN